MASDPASRGGDLAPTSREAEKTPVNVDDAQDVEGSGGEEVKAVSGLGARPECFKNTFQEVAFVFMATIAMATNTFLTGSTVIVTAAIGKDLDMTQSQISWIAAAAT